jgi:hypothetical protein
VGSGQRIAPLVKPFQQSGPQLYPIGRGDFVVEYPRCREAARMGCEQLPEHCHLTSLLGQRKSHHVLDVRSGEVACAGHELGNVWCLRAEQERQPELIVQYEFCPEPVP